MTRRPEPPAPHLRRPHRLTTMGFWPVRARTLGEEGPRERGRAQFWARILARRILWGAVVLLAIATVTFFLTHYVPSDPAVFSPGQPRRHER